MAHGLIRGSFVPPPAIQEIRDLARTRKQLVRQIAQGADGPSSTVDSHEGEGQRAPLCVSAYSSSGMS